MKFVIPLNALMNAIKCSAVDDVRYYLNGVHITKDSIQSTNGHIAYEAEFKISQGDYEIAEEYKSGNELPDSMTIKMTQKIKAPAKKHGCELVLVDVSGNDAVIKLIDRYGKLITCYLGEVLSAERYPDFERIKPSEDEEPSGVPVIGFCGDYLKTIGEVAEGDFKGIRVETFGEHKISKFTMIDYNQYYQATVYLMPIRI